MQVLSEAAAGLYGTHPRPRVPHYAERWAGRPWRGGLLWENKTYSAAPPRPQGGAGKTSGRSPSLTKQDILMPERTDRRAAERFPVNQETRCDFAAVVA